MMAVVVGIGVGSYFYWSSYDDGGDVIVGL